MDLSALAAELASGHPDTGAYDADSAIAATQINVVNRKKNRTSMTGSEVLNAVNAGEWVALTDAQRQTVWDVVHLGDVNPFGIEATLITNVFGGGSATITELADARKEDVSRADELGLGQVRTGTVQQARAL